MSNVLLWFLQGIGLVPSEADRTFLRLLCCHQVKLRLHFTLQRSGGPSYFRVFSLNPKLAPPSTDRELHLIVLVAGHERPPALDPLLLEDGDGGKLLLIPDHIQGTLLGRLGSARESVQVQLDRACARTRSGESALSRGLRESSSSAPVLTEEVVGGEVVGVPDLHREARGDLVLGLVPGEHGLLLRDDNLLLRHEVIEGEDEAPVEVALSGQGVVVHVRVLLVLLLSL